MHLMHGEGGSERVEGGSERVEGGGERVGWGKSIESLI